MLKIFLVFLLNGVCAAETVDADSATVATAERNSNEVLPSYTQIDNATEKSVSFSWGTVFYTSTTNGEVHDHSNAPQTVLNVRYSCKNSPTRKSNPQRFQFCGYSVSQVDTQARTRILAELRRSHPSKSDAALQVLYDAEYNDRIVDPVWSITDLKTGNQNSVQINVRENHGEFGSCENNVTALSLPVNCP